MSRQNGVVRVIDEHPDRDEIIRRLLQGETARSLSREYGIDHSAFSRTKRNIQKRVEPIVMASLAEVNPQFAAKTEQARPLTAWKLAERLDTALDELEEVKQRPDARPNHIISATSAQARVADTLTKIMQVAAEHRDVRNAPEYQRLLKATSQVLKEFPNARERFRQVYESMAPATEEVPHAV